MKIKWVIPAILLALTLGLFGAARPLNIVDSTKSESAAVVAQGAAQLFSRNCAKCHGRDGRAKGLKARLGGVRNLTDAKWQDGVSDERLFNSINNGKGKMPAFGKKLSEAQVDELVKYVRGLKK